MKYAYYKTCPFLEVTIYNLEAYLFLIHSKKISFKDASITSNNQAKFALNEALKASKSYSDLQMLLCKKIYPKVGWYYKKHPLFDLVIKQKKFPKKNQNFRGFDINMIF